MGKIDIDLEIRGSACLLEHGAACFTDFGHDWQHRIVCETKVKMAEGEREVSDKYS